MPGVVSAAATLCSDWPGGGVTSRPIQGSTTGCVSSAAEVAGRPCAWRRLRNAGLAKSAPHAAKPAALPQSETALSATLMDAAVLLGSSAVATSPGPHVAARRVMAAVAGVAREGGRPPSTTVKLVLYCTEVTATLLGVRPRAPARDDEYAADAIASTTGALAPLICMPTATSGCAGGLGGLGGGGSGLGGRGGGLGVNGGDGGMTSEIIDGLMPL